MQVGPVRIKPTKKVETSDEDIIEKLEAEGLHSDEHIALFKEMLDKELVSKDKSLPEMERGQEQPTQILMRALKKQLAQ